MGKILRTRITSKIILLKKIKPQTITDTMINDQRISYFRTTHSIRPMTKKTATESTDNGLHEIPTNINNVPPKHEDFKRNRYSTIQSTEGL